MSYTFRLRFLLPDSTAINIDTPEWPINDIDGKDVVMRPVQKGSIIKDSRNLCIIGKGYESANTAYRAGEFYRDVFVMTASRLGIGIDFGTFAPESIITEAGLQMFERDRGQRVLNDVHGLMVYETNPTPQLASIHLDTVVNKSKNNLEMVLNHVLEHNRELTVMERLAFDLFSMSFFQNSADARFLMLMLSIETLIDQQPRQKATKQHIDHLIGETKLNSDISDDDKKSIIGALNGLYKESVGQAGRRLVEQLGDRKYDDQKPKKFFSTCYRKRGLLVHGHLERPTRDEVDRMAAHLTTMIGDLLCGEVLSLEL